jgi:ribosomal protein S27E
LQFLDYNSVVDVEKLIPQDVMETFKTLSDEYQFKLKDSLKEADEVERANQRHPSDPDVPDIRIDCESCGNFTMVVNKDSATGYRCTFCGNEEGDNVPTSCGVCGAICVAGDLAMCEGDDGRIDYRCYYCSGRYAADRARDD